MARAPRKPPAGGRAKAGAAPAARKRRAPAKATGAPARKPASSAKSAPAKAKRPAAAPKTAAKTASKTTAAKTAAPAKSAPAKGRAKAAAPAKSAPAKGRAKAAAAARGKRPAARRGAARRKDAAASPVLSVDAVAREARRFSATAPKTADLDRLVPGEPAVKIDGLRAGYGAMEILHGFDLRVGKGQSLCLIGPNGAGKSTVLHSIFGFTRITGGTIVVDGADVTRRSPQQRLKSSGIAYILQDNSVFPDMTVEENLWLGGYLMPSAEAAKAAAERVFEKYARLAARRRQPAGVLSGGERRLLEISRALVMDPKVLLVDEPSIGLEPRFIDAVFEILADLQKSDDKTIIMVEQNAKKGLEFADLGYVLASGELVKAGTGDALLADPEVGRLFLGG